MNNSRPIKDEWKDYYDVLEGIRRTGVCNMWGSAIYLAEFCPELTLPEAQEILLSWIANYNTLSEKYGWRKKENTQDE